MIENGVEYEPEFLATAEAIRCHNDKRIVVKATDDLDFFYNKMRELAEGVWVLKVDKVTGQTQQIYKRPPDFKALAYFLDRIAGRMQGQEERVERFSHGVIEVQNIIKSFIEKDNNNGKRLQLETGGGDKSMPNQVGEGAGLDILSE